MIHTTIHDKLNRFITDFGGPPDTLFLSRDNIITLHHELHIVDGQLREGSTYMGMTIVQSNHLQLNVGLVS